MATAVPSARVELAVLVACSFVDVVAFRKVGLTNTSKRKKTNAGEPVR